LHLKIIEFRFNHRYADPYKVSESRLGAPSIGTKSSGQRPRAEPE
jgi:hypothetical protein